MPTLAEDAKIATGAAKSATDLGVELAKKNRELEAAQRIEDPDARAKKTKEIEASVRDLQANTLKSIGDQLLKDEDKKRFDMMIEAGKLIRERALSDKGLFPDWEELTSDPTDQGRSPLQMLGSNFSQLEALAKAAGYEKEFKALNAGLQVADIFDRYGLGDGSFSDIFGNEKQLKGLQELVDKGELSSVMLGQVGLTLDNIQSGLGMLSALGGYFGFGKDIAKVQKVVSALKGLQQAFTGDITGGIDAILALDGLFFNLPPEAKEALTQAKKLAKELKKMGHMKPITGPPGVFVEGKHIAALGLSGTIHGMPLAPGPGSPTVFSYNMPVWRTVSDKHVCMLPGPGPAPHMPPPGGIVPKGATKTFANKLLIARHDDSTLEANGGGLVKIIPLPEALAIALKRAAEEAEKKRKEQERKKAEKAAKAKKDEENRMKRDKHKALRERQDKFEKIAKGRESSSTPRPPVTPLGPPNGCGPTPTGLKNSALNYLVPDNLPVIDYSGAIPLPGNMSVDVSDICNQHDKDFGMGGNDADFERANRNLANGVYDRLIANGVDPYTAAAHAGAYYEAVSGGREYFNDRETRMTEEEYNEARKMYDEEKARADQAEREDRARREAEEASMDRDHYPGQEEVDEKGKTTRY